MNRDTVRNRIEQTGIIPAVRVSSTDDALFAAEMVLNSGISIVEITMTVPAAANVIQQLARKYPDLIAGGGTVVDIDTARRCLDAGARFLTSPGLALEIVEFALKNDTVVFPGALTPSEIMMASKAGSDFVKVFPCSVLGGVTYIRALKSPFPNVPLIAAGGVTQQNAADFIRAGAVAVGIGRELIPPEAVDRREADWIRELAGRFMKMMKEARASNLS